MDARSRCLVASFAGLLATGVQAQPVSITNPGFEDNFAPIGGFPVLVPNGGSLYDPGGFVKATWPSVRAKSISTMWP